MVLYPDHVIVVLDASCGRVQLHVITSLVRSASLAMTAAYMRPLIDSYALYCARSAMLLKWSMQKYVQNSLDAYRAFQKRHNGVAWPLMRSMHPLLEMTAKDVYVSTAVEFLPSHCATLLISLISNHS